MALGNEPISPIMPCSGLSAALDFTSPLTASLNTVIDSNNQHFIVVEFSDATDQFITFLVTMGRSYSGGGIDFIVYGAMSTTNTGTKTVVLNLSIQKIIAGGLANTPMFGVVKKVTMTVNNATNTVFSGTISFTSGELTGIYPGMFLRLLVHRSTAEDDASGLFRLVAMMTVET